jgi:hypothetical protein
MGDWDSIIGHVEKQRDAAIARAEAAEQRAEGAEATLASVKLVNAELEREREEWRRAFTHWEGVAEERWQNYLAAQDSTKAAEQRADKAEQARDAAIQMMQAGAVLSLNKIEQAEQRADPLAAEAAQLRAALEAGTPVLGAEAGFTCAGYSRHTVRATYDLMIAALASPAGQDVLAVVEAARDAYAAFGNWQRHCDYMAVDVAMVALGDAVAALDQPKEK